MRHLAHCSTSGVIRSKIWYQDLKNCYSILLIPDFLTLGSFLKSGLAIFKFMIKVPLIHPPYRYPSLHHLVPSSR